ncbi:hypothetical protein NXS19_009445 [Fusarium pseudograminearum]|nr:hypothetical protein NXS19_009445 [Fusarium pseudograminearum]
MKASRNRFPSGDSSRILPDSILYELTNNVKQNNEDDDTDMEGVLSDNSIDTLSVGTQLIAATLATEMNLSSKVETCSITFTTLKLQSQNVMAAPSYVLSFTKLYFPPFR